jgi:hypothetical protein
VAMAYVVPSMNAGFTFRSVELVTQSGFTPAGQQTIVSACNVSISVFTSRRDPWGQP